MERYIAEAIRSVLRQSYTDWELILVNDGSTDQSKSVVHSFSDSRIRYFEQGNMGASAARNLGLREMTGSFFLFLDADDMLPPESLLSRMKLFDSDPKLSFVDGMVLRMSSDMERVLERWIPKLIGNPFLELVRLSGRPFAGLTWMVKRSAHVDTFFQEGLTHGEDLLFYLALARHGGQYAFVDDPVLYYRDTPGSAMKNLKLLQDGYRTIFNTIKDWPECAEEDLAEFKARSRRIMFRSFARDLQIIDALKVYWNW